VTDEPTEASLGNPILNSCFSQDGHNIVIFQEMKEFLALMFFKGALLSDPDGILEQQGPNSRSALRICFRSIDDANRLADTVKAYVEEAGPLPLFPSFRSMGC
jgi:uncharacterized protein YdeI (YjbR/CyaY-like superfamily)